MKNRTRDPRQEMAAIETLQDIRDSNPCHAYIKIEQMLAEKLKQEKQYQLLKRQHEEEEEA